MVYAMLTNMVYAVDPNNSVIKRLWCNIIGLDKSEYQVNSLLMMKIYVVGTH